MLGAKTHVNGVGPGYETDLMGKNSAIRQCFGV